MMYQNLPTKSLSEADQKMVDDWMKKNKPLVLEDGVLKRGRKVIAVKSTRMLRSKNTAMITRRWLVVEQLKLNLTNGFK